MKENHSISKYFSKISYKNKITISFLIIFIFLFHFGPYINNEYTFSPFQDSIHWFNPLKYYLSSLLNNGEIPLIADDDITSIYHSPFHSVFYPFDFLFFNFRTGPLKTIHVEYYITLFHLFILLSGIYLWARFLELPADISLFGASAFAFSSFVSVIAAWSGTLYSNIWTILAIGSLTAILYSKNNIKGLFLLILTCSMILLAFPTNFFRFFYIATFIYFMWFFSEKNKLKTKLKVLLILIFSAFIVVLIGGHSLISFILHSDEYARWIKIGAKSMKIVGPGDIPFKATIMDQLNIKELLGVIYPINKTRYHSNFIGPAIVTLSLIPIFFCWKNKFVKIYSILAVYFLISTAGSNLGAAYINYLLPGLNAQRHAWAYIFFFLIFLCLLSAIGLNCLRNGESITKKIILLNSIYFSILFVGFFLEFYKYSNFKFYFINVLSLCILNLITINSKKILKIKSVLILLLICLTSMLQSEYTYNLPRRISLSSYFNPGNILSHMALSYLNNREKSEQRILVSLSKKFDTSKRKVNMNAYYYEKLKPFTIFGSPQPNKEFMIFNTGYIDLFKSYGLKYLISDEPKYLKDKNFKKIKTIGSLNIYENKNVFPKFAFFDSFIGTVKNENDFLNLTKKESVIPNQIYLRKKDSKEVDLWLKKDQKKELKSNIIEEKNNHSYKYFNVYTNKKSILFINIYYKPEWKFYVNRKEVKPLILNHNQIGIKICPGSASVEMVFRPRVYNSYLLMSFLFFFIYLICILYFIMEKLNLWNKSEIKALP